MRGRWVGDKYPSTLLENIQSFTELNPQLSTSYKVATPASFKVQLDLTMILQAAK